MLSQPKVAIPRLQRPSQDRFSGKERSRVSRACTACRIYKVKCTGNRPQCKHCVATDRECVYVLPRKDRLRIVTERCQQMAVLLRDLKSLASSENEAKILELLEVVDQDMLEDRQATASGPDVDANEVPCGSTGSSDADHFDELDRESLDFLDEDLHASDYSRATGFVGKSSEMQWLRAVAMAQPEQADEEASGQFQRRRSSAPGSHQVSSFTFWSDSEGIDVDFYVDPYEMPQPEIAERLVVCYMTKVHHTFPILSRKIFEEQFRTYFRAVRSGNAPRLSPKWQAILNLVFAISARYSHFVKADWRGDENDYITYLARAQAFSLNEDSHPDLSRIQGLGLLAFYWLAVGHVSRAWMTVGAALRFAYSLGLHVRNEDCLATAVKRETLVNVWWSLYSLERTLSIITGRPSIVVDSCCSVPLPTSVPENQSSVKMEAAYNVARESTTPPYKFSDKAAESQQIPIHPKLEGTNSGPYFKAVITLSIIVQDISGSLYSVSTMIQSPEDLQLQVTHLNQRLEQWTSLLPQQLNFRIKDVRQDVRLASERTILGFQLCSAKMLLTRPYLSGRRHPCRENGEASFSKRMGNTCIEAAKAMVDFLPIDPHPQAIYDQGPWWCIVHHLMQAVSVFLLGLSYLSSSSYETATLIYCINRIMEHFQIMQDPVAQRAYEKTLESFDTMVRRGILKASDGKATTTRPSGLPIVTDFETSVQTNNPAFQDL